MPAAGPPPGLQPGRPGPDHSCVCSRPFPGRVLEAAVASLAFRPPLPRPSLLPYRDWVCLSPCSAALKGSVLWESRGGGSKVTPPRPALSCCPVGSRQGQGAVWPGSLCTPTVLIFLGAWREGCRGGRGRLRLVLDTRVLWLLPGRAPSLPPE